MRRVPLLSCVLWTSLAVGCGDDEPIFVDAAPPALDASLATAEFAATLTMEADCGVASPPTVDLTITNTGTEPLVVSGASATGGFTVTTAEPLTIAPAGTGVLTVRPPAAVIGTDLGGTTKTGVLSFTTNETGAPTRTVDLASTINGANLVLADREDQPLTMLSFAAASGCPAPTTVRVRNTGNRDASLDDPSASGFGFGGFSPSSFVPAQGSVQHTVSVFTLGPCSGTATVSYEATGTVCTAPLALPTTFTLPGSSGCFCS
ncbi:MAG TPA: hypothetical protein VM734_23610 [Kofleriaceae bacterium]|jgi:hypothetical protein|nr:hypothetical protein [Kofleriaceae bacterium]